MLYRILLKKNSRQFPAITECGKIYIHKMYFIYTTIWYCTLYTINVKYVCLYYPFKYMHIFTYIVLYSYMVYISFVFKFFGMTQRRALICCSVHFIPLLIRRVVRVDRTFTDVHIHKYIHKYVFIYTCVCVLIYVCIHLSRDPAFAMVAALAYTYILYLWGTCRSPRHCLSTPTAPLPYLPTPTQQAHTLPCSRTSTWTRCDRGRGLGRLLLSLSLHSAVALGSLFVMLASCDRHNFSFFSSNMRVYMYVLYT